MRYEESLALDAERELQVSTAFVPIEVLESYLEDLLNAVIPDERLFIKTRRSGLASMALALVGMVGATILGLLAVSSGAPLVLSLALTVCLAFPFAVLWHFAPREGAARRMRLAQVLSRVIAYRRGGDRGESRRSGRTLLSELLAGKTSETTQGAAKIMFH